MPRQACRGCDGVPGDRRLPDLTAARTVDAIPMMASAAGPRNYPYNCWWVAGFRHQVGRSLLSRWLLDTPVLLKENVLDLSHLGFVHAKSFGVTDRTHPPEVTTDDDRVTYCQRFIECPLPTGYALALGLEPGIIWNRETTGSYVSPALQISAVDLCDPSRPGAPAVGRYRFAHATTPVDAGSMLYFWVVGRDHATHAEEMAHFEGIIKQGFTEDEAMLEAIQRLAVRTPRRGSSGERSVKADVAGVQARRILDRWMARETIA